jgi:hypothetical protein
MKISRRWFMAGLALTGAAVPAAYFGHREWTKPDPTITPGEAAFDVADTAGQRWRMRCAGCGISVSKVPMPASKACRQGLQVFLDIGQKGRGVRSRHARAPAFR